MSIDYDPFAELLTIAEVAEMMWISRILKFFNQLSDIWLFSGSLVDLPGLKETIRL
jgi:hypothetical protein